jgi:cysteine synthase
MARTRKNQTKHDETVRGVARRYQRKGYNVEADVTGFDQPGTIRGVRPDVRARKGGHETIVEVETPDSVDSKRDQKQQKAFKGWSKGSSTKHYRRVVTDD